MLRQAGCVSCQLEVGCAQGQPGRAPVPQYGPAAGSPRRARVCLGARSPRGPRAGRGPSTPASCSHPAQRALCGFQDATPNPPPRPRTPDIPRPRRPANSPTCCTAPALGRVSDSRAGISAPRRGPSPGSLCRAPRQKPRAGSRACGTYLCRGITSHAMLAMEPLPARLPAVPLAAPATPPAPRRGERPAPGRGEGAAGPGLAADDGPPQHREPRPGPPAATPATAPVPARPTGPRQARVNQKRLLMSSWFWTCKRCHKRRANGSFQREDPDLLYPFQYL